MEVVDFYIIKLYYFRKVLECKELDGTSQKGKCKEMGGTEGVIYKKSSVVDSR